MWFKLKAISAKETGYRAISYEAVAVHPASPANPARASARRMSDKRLGIDAYAARLRDPSTLMHSQIRNRFRIGNIAL